MQRFANFGAQTRKLNAKPPQHEETPSIRKELKLKLLQRCRDRAKTKRNCTVTSARAKTCEERNFEHIALNEFLEKETPFANFQSEQSFLQNLSQEEYEDWMLALEEILKEDQRREEEEFYQSVVEEKAMEELEYERYLLETYSNFF
eukprot:jgi/Galph1/4723/GphlegSOOS_G3352.1